MATTVINLSSLDGTNGFSMTGASQDFSELSVSGVGDINDDNFDDVIIGADQADSSGFRSGSSYVVFGKASGFDDTINLSSLDGNNGFRLDGVAAWDSLGRSVSSAGDINGDGFDDVITGAPGADGNNGDNYYGLNGGSSYVVFGKASGFDAMVDLSSLDGSNGFRLDGSGNNNTGTSVSNAGDVNGDGFDDVIIGAEFAGGSYDYTGASYVVFGKASGFEAKMNLSSINGTNGFSMNGIEKYDRFGHSVSNAGDINGDGFDDLIVSTADRYSKTFSSYVVLGKASGFDATLDLSSLDGTNGFRLDGEAGFERSVSNAGDVNNDGFDDVSVNVSQDMSYIVFGKASGFDATLDLSSLDGTNGFRQDGGPISNAGDVNGDGFDDVVISNYVVFGKASGFDTNIDLSSLDSNSGFRLEGPSGPISSAGDVNGDGFDDLIVPGVNPSNSGSSYVVFGRSSFTDNGVIRGTPEDDILTGTSAAERFEAGDGNDRMIGRGGADVFLGEAGNDYIRISDLSFESVNGGIGNDALALGGSGLNLNLTVMAGKISGIETIRLFGTGDNTLTLTAADVLNLSDTSNTLKVNGNAGDRIVGLSHGWGDGGVHGDFHTYFNDAAVLLVGVNVATDFA
ncbi:integrin alpha [Nitrosomonas sp. Nm166]|uniref:integrin alpha n=1 Tax=Nitrosomonas sp. Nm166 TaxID=1881054 RepID=UPI0008F318E1|nr:integrin alpha [Nitrosomonas sp. Nm166]SFD95694.1 FG-GAP repeat-containing protein [Nitrosomonas sp. Nm166]